MADHDNAYAPPTTAVADPERVAALGSRPREVRLAVILLWLSWGLSIPMWVLAAMRDPDTHAGPFAIALTLFFMALAAWLNTLVYRGRNWARITMLVLVALSVLFVVFPPDGLSEPGFVERVLNFADVCVQVSAIVLLFRRPGALWFRFADGKAR